MAARPTTTVGKLGYNLLGAPSSPWGTNWSTKDETDQKTKQLVIEDILGNVILPKYSIAPPSHNLAPSSHMVAPLAQKDLVGYTPLGAPSTGELMARVQPELVRGSPQVNHIQAILVTPGYKPETRTRMHELRNTTDGWLYTGKDANAEMKHEVALQRVAKPVRRLQSWRM